MIGLCVLLLAGAGAQANQAPFGSVDVLIDVGHGGVDGGTSHGSLLEKHINLAIALKLYDKLLGSGYRVALNRSKDYALSDDNKWLGSKSRHIRDLAQRKLLVDALKPKLTVSLHTNWSPSTRNSGPSVLYQKNESSRLAGQLLSDRLNRLYGTSAPPFLGKTFYLLNKTKTPAVIVEMGYISNPRDRAMLTEEDGQKQIAEAIASALVQYISVFRIEP